MTRLNLIGDKYGKLLVIEETEQRGKERMFLCKCDCGNYTEVAMGSLRSGNTKSCGCYRDRLSSEKQRSDHTGKRFGKLTAVKRVGKSNKIGNTTTPFWECLCDCGNKTIVRSTNLISGHTTSCGCLAGRPNLTGTINTNKSNITKVDIITKIEEIYKNGEKRPSLRSLEKEFGCSRQTISNKLNGDKIMDIWNNLKKEHTR